MDITLNELPRNINLEQSPYIILIYTLCFVILGINFTLSNQSFKARLVLFFSLKKESKHIEQYSKILTGIIGFTGFALFILNALNYFIPDFFVKNNSILYSQIFQLAGMIILLLFIYMIFKIIIIRIIEHLFSVNHFVISSCIRGFTSSFVNLGILLFLLSFFAFYSTFPFTFIIWITGTVIAVFFIIKQTLSSFRSFSFKANTLYRFFLYLCTFEILPILVLIKCLSDFIV